MGPGDIEFHYYKMLGISKEEFEKQVEEIARALAESGVEIELLPDRGICFEIAKKYKEADRKRVIATFPKNDKIFGIKHLQQYLEIQVNGKPLFDKIIDSKNWFKHDLIKGLFGDALLYLGSSPGTDGELNYATYLFKLIKRNKPGIETKIDKIHPELRAGKNCQFTYLIYTPFIKASKLSDEEEAYIKKFGINLVYVSNPNELKSKLEGLARS